MKACPFCGSKAKKHKYTILGEDFKVAYCPNENCHFHHRTASVADWNTRPIEDALNKRIEQLQKDNDDFCSQLSDLTSEKDELFDEALEYKSERDEARAMVERLIAEIDKHKGGYPVAGDNWYGMGNLHTLVAEWKEREE